MTIRLHIDSARIATLTFDRPGSSANVFDLATLDELDAHLATLEAAGDLRGVVLRSAKPGIFIAGADLHAFAATGFDPSALGEIVDRGHAVFSRLAALPVPSVAAIHGVCLGGGLELALACDWRVASDDAATKLGLPETQLGIVPAWGGCVRLPGLVGLAAALTLIVPGRRLAAKPAIRIGLVDTLSRVEYLDAAARRLIARGRRPLRVRFRLIDCPFLRPLVVHLARRRTLGKTRGRHPAPLRAIEVCSAAYRRPREIGFGLERDALIELAATPVARNLIGLFFDRERVKKSAAQPGVPHGSSSPFTQRPPRVAAVIGAGVMGAGIAQWLAARGLTVRLQDVSPETLAAGLARVEKLTADARRHHRLDAVSARAALDRVTPIDADASLRGVDLVVEAAMEKLDLKQALFRRLEARVAPETILATNTSGLSIDAIADGLAHPGRVVGLHFFNPVHRMPLVEIVRGPRTSTAVVDALRRFVVSIDKLPVVVRDRPGFFVNRVLVPGLIEAVRLFRAGLPVERIDAALLDFGLPMGPLRLADEVGLDIALHVARDLAERLPHLAAPDDTLDRMLARGWLGKKSGGGFYLHPPKGEARPNPALVELRERAAMPTPTAAGTSDDDIADRVVLCMVNEAARCLDEGVIESAADADFAMILGTGWAPFRGGPLRHADALGASAVVARLDALALAAGPHLAPCERLRAMARQGDRFYPASP